MKYINKYKNFNPILESLLLESVMLYGHNFTKILRIISFDREGNAPEIAKAILDTVGEDINTTMNYIDISDNKGFLKFIQDNRVDKDNLNYMLNSNARFHYKPENLTVYGEDGESAKEELSKIKFKNVNPAKDAKFKIVKAYTYPSPDNYSHRMYHLKNIDDNSDVFIYSSKGYNPFIPVLDNKYTDIRSGRLIRNILNTIDFKYTEKDIEDFINTFYAKLDMLDKKLDIVSGEDIRYWYNKNNYHAETGSLGSSCMRFSYCSSYFDIYVENPDVCQLVIFKSDDELLLGRALLWTDINGNQYMDTIYCAKDYIKYIFENWADNNGVDKISGEVKVKVEAKDYEEYPYLDTLYYYYIDEGILSNTNIMSITTDYYSLCETNGSYEGPYNND